jgi:hypothetical protein
LISGSSMADDVTRPDTKPRRVSNRGKAVVTNNALHSIESEAAQVHEDWTEVDSEVVQAGCKNCANNTNDFLVEDAPVVTTYRPDRQQVEYVDESFADTTFEESSCDSCPSVYAGDPCGLTPFELLCGIRKRLTVRADASTFWSNGQQLPTLVTNNGDSVFGGGEFQSTATPGFRGEIGLWLDPCQSKRVVVRGFYAGDNDAGFRGDNSNFSNLALPFRQISPATSTSLLVTDTQAGLTGNVDANLSQKLYGGDLLIERNIYRDHLVRFDILGGAQTARLAESLVLQSVRAQAGVTNDLRDEFTVRNQFHGATFGLNFQAREGNWYLGSMFKLGMGNMERLVQITGREVVSVQTPPNTTTTNSGLHANADTNMGTYKSNTFVMTPELALTLGYRLTRNLDFTVGYSMVRLPKVTRVGSALDSGLRVDTRTPPVSGNPLFEFREYNFTLHGLNLGLQWQF